MNAINPPEKRPVRARMKIFRAAGEPLPEDMMHPEALHGADADAFAKAEAAGIHEGHDIRCLYRSPLPDGPSLCRMWLKSGFITPRHRHDTNCLYFVLAGELRLGNAVLGPGDGAYVPQGTVYSVEAGPEGLDLLEFRTDTVFNVEYTSNNDNFWERVIGATMANAAQWPEQTRPAESLEPIE